MKRYQQADAEALRALIAGLSPLLLRYFRSQSAIRDRADDLLQETWLRIHRVRHTYRPDRPVLPWAHAIARGVGIDAYRRRRRIESFELAVDVLPEPHTRQTTSPGLPDFEILGAELPQSQREVITMLKVGGLTLEEVALATSSTVGAVKLKAHRAFVKLRQRMALNPAADEERCQ
jgi:RNA polymerase sigma-70 factor, ECF subfamily